MLTLLVDNHDSFTGNLFHQLALATGREPLVIRNDEPDVDLGRLLATVDNVVLSPGPGTPHRPSDVGWCEPIVRAACSAGPGIPLLGVCLGHQTLAHVLGGEVGLAPPPWHGRESAVRHDGTDLFARLPDPLRVVRYHSLAVHRLPPSLLATAWSEDGVLMGLRHRDRPCWGVQFHPESIRTEHGDALVENFVELTGRWQARTGRRPPPTRTPARRPPVPTAVDTASDAASRTAPDAARARRRLRVLVETVVTACPDEVLYDRLWRAGRHAFWLDSGDPHDPRGRFSVMGDASGPLARVLRADVPGGTVSIEGAAGDGTDDEPARTERRPLLDWLAEDLAGLDVEVPALPFGFALGWVGYLGYELKGQCGGSVAHRSTEPDAVLVFADRALVLDHATGTAYLLALAPRDDEADTDPNGGARWLSRTRRRIEAMAALRPASDSPPDPILGLPPDGSGRPPILALRHDRDAYLARIDACLEQIGRGETYEICLTNMVDAPPVPDAWQAYRALRRISPTPFGALLSFGDVQVLSTSPERFLRVTADGAMESRPIKGTRPRGADPDEDERLRRDLAGSVKDRAENLMVVDLVRNDLGRCAEVGSVHVPVLFGVETYRSVHQLVSVVRARLRRGSTAVDAVRAAFPGGSMTGAPKERTMAIIDRLEGGPRGVYSGAIGYFSVDGACDLSIAIRVVVQTPDRLSYGVGGAIVALSDPTAELEETAVKAEPLLRLLGTAFPGR
jgi:para-aminobenzoate synthetase